MKAVVNEDSSADITALKHEIRLLKEELSSLKRQNVSRALSFGQTTISGDSRLEDDSSYDEKALETDQHGSLIRKEAKGIFKSLETTLAGSLRREQMALKLLSNNLKLKLSSFNRLQIAIYWRNSALTEEIQLLHSKVDRNPEVTRFACENIRLLEELWRYQDFYEGEREILLAEVSNLRDQLLTNIDGNLKQHSHLDMNIPSQESIHACDKQTTLH
ncbi:hypothetical protein K7X08_036949 [Anisodus acutangulus]|uniref:Uncharacterized protein n=1 Tax=Anisodus acutangulus TaxID=402998 RepID=A0A9Q1LAM5_9SOLA|nr:hypothetical protein K7X08_036949 [Anisodus acutangulus]